MRVNCLLWMSSIVLAALGCKGDTHPNVHLLTASNDQGSDPIASFERSMRRSRIGVPNYRDFGLTIKLTPFKPGGSPTKPDWYSAISYFGYAPSPRKPVFPTTMRNVHVEAESNWMDSEMQVKETIENYRKQLSVAMLSGSFSGQPIGDHCLRISGRSGGSTVLLVAFGRHKLKAWVSCGVDTIPKEGAVERAAKLWVERCKVIDELAKLDPTLYAPTIQLAAGEVRSVKQFAKEHGCSYQWDANGQRVIVQKGTRILEIFVGTWVGTIQGKTVRLSSPALRRGEDDIWCPTLTLSEFIRADHR